VHELSPLTFAATISAIVSAVILIAYLIWRPPLTRTTKLWLLLGLGVFPVGSAAATNVEGFKATQQRKFCGSCHVMTPYEKDVGDVASAGLAARHGRNPFFGRENCYVCHADYGMYGTVLTKMGGMRHVWLYYTEFSSMPLEESRKKIHLVKPYPNENCMQCHSTSNPLWQKSPDHKASLQDVREGRISCASEGCHGFAHPWSKDAQPARMKDGERP
jgi:cytochrome c-type protein NapC